MPKPPNIVSPAEFADELGRSYVDVLEWAKRGVIPALRARGRIFIDRDRALLALAELNRTAGVEEANPCPA